MRLPEQLVGAVCLVGDLALEGPALGLAAGLGVGRELGALVRELHHHVGAALDACVPKHIRGREDEAVLPLLVGHAGERERFLRQARGGGICGTRLDEEAEG